MAFGSCRGSTGYQTGLFLVILNDLSADTSNGFFKYVDDTTVYEIVEKKEPSHAQSILDEVSTWSANNKFQLHPSKCNELRITFPRSPTKYELVEIAGCKINTVQVVKLLGVYIQEDLKWDSHVIEMTKKSVKRLYFLAQLKRANVPPEELVQFYVACIQSVLLYGCQVFHFSRPQYLSLSFERIQKRALRIIFCYEVHYSDALALSGLVTLEQRRTEPCKKRFNNNP